MDMLWQINEYSMIVKWKSQPIHNRSKRVELTKDIRIQSNL